MEELAQRHCALSGWIAGQCLSRRCADAVWRWVVKNSAWILLIVAYLVMRAVFVCGGEGSSLPKNWCHLYSPSLRMGGGVEGFEI